MWVLFAGTVCARAMAILEALVHVVEGVGGSSGVHDDDRVG